ncbi:MAG: AraC family transcriptional regulator [Moraxellaceae bacterium]|nr:AraC family transcriptional regulator [Moraxellaceae bacterium]
MTGTRTVPPTFPPVSAGISNLVMRQVLQLGAFHGVDMTVLLGEVGLREEWLQQADGWVGAKEVEHLLRRAIHKIDNPLTGLQAAPHVNLSMLGVLGYVSQTSSTLQGLIESTRRFERLLSDIGTTTLHHEPGAAVWEWQCSLIDDEVRRHVIECVIGCWAGMLRLARRSTTRPLLAVRFCHALPAGAQQSQYDRFFGCPVHFGQRENALVIAPSALSLPLALADPTLHRALEEHARQQLATRRRDATLVDAVRSLVRQEFNQGLLPARDRIASQLGMSARSLHRKLDEAGHSFRGLLDDVRLELARTTLREQPHPVADVAQQLGFQESQSFIRWFKRLQGATPGEYRNG